MFFPAGTKIISTWASEMDELGAGGVSGARVSKIN